MKLTYRLTNFILLLFCLTLLTTSFYFQYANIMQPCLLCFMQRVFYIAISFVLFISCLHQHNRLTLSIYNTLLIILGALGLMTAFRQIWLQHVPSGQPSTCLPNAIFLFKTLPLHKALQLSYSGTAECARINWTFLGLTIADWSAICFGIILAVVIWQFRFLVQKEKG